MSKAPAAPRGVQVGLLQGVEGHSALLEVQDCIDGLGEPLLPGEPIQGPDEEMGPGAVGLSGVGQEPLVLLAFNLTRPDLEKVISGELSSIDEAVDG